MGIKKTDGFTIIEVMLFLAVTGLLTVGILVGSGVAIGQQRYRDSVNTFKSLLQEQFNQTANTVNSRGGDESCANAVVLAPPENVPNPQARGTSDCLLMGRLFTLGPDGKQYTISNVVGYRTSTTADEEATDIDELRENYRLGVATESSATGSIEWDSQIVQPKTTTPLSLSLMTIRSPLSGTLMTFVQDGVQTDLNAMVAGGVTNQDRNLCVDAPAGSFVGERLAVRIGAYATSQAAIEIPSESEGICD